MKKVRWEEMFPDELDAALADRPVAYLTYGLCEPHGLHNAVGLDALKAHAYFGRVAADLLAAYQQPAQPRKPAPGNPLGALTFGETERIWLEEIQPILYHPGHLTN